MEHKAKVLALVFCYSLQCIIQICHASVGIVKECLPEGGWFSRGHTGMAYLFYYTKQTPIWYNINENNNDCR